MNLPFLSRENITKKKFQMRFEKKVGTILNITEWIDRNEAEIQFHGLESYVRFSTGILKN